MTGSEALFLERMALPIALTFRAFRTVAPLTVWTRLIVGPLGHATVMADSRKLVQVRNLGLVIGRDRVRVKTR